MENVLNPSLKDLEVFVGTWKLELRFPNDPPGTVQTQAAFEWLEDGAFLVMHSGTKGEGTPYAYCVIGRDNGVEDYTMLYFDNRGVSRIYNMSFKDGIWTQWRDADPNFRQRFTGKFSADRNTITAKWENASGGSGDWNHDFDLIYTRV
jgi:hypothetical protein